MLHQGQWRMLVVQQDQSTAGRRPGRVALDNVPQHIRVLPGSPRERNSLPIEERVKPCLRLSMRRRRLNARLLLPVSRSLQAIGPRRNHFPHATRLSGRMEQNSTALTVSSPSQDSAGKRRSTCQLSRPIRDHHVTKNSHCSLVNKIRWLTLQDLLLQAGCMRQQ